MKLVNRAVKVLFVVRSLHVGGMEQMVIALATCLSRQGYDVRFCTIEDPGQLADQLPAEIELVALHKPPGLRLDYALRLRKVLAAWRPDIVHTHNETGHFYAALANIGIPRKSKLIHTQHGRTDIQDKKAIIRNRLASRLSHIVVAVSDDVGTVCRDVEYTPVDKLRTIINGIDLDPYLAVERDPDDTKAIVFGHVGRLSPVKNQELMINAFHKVHQQLPQARLILAGDGPLRAQLEDQARKLGVGSNVSFLGYQSDIAAVVADIDIFLLTSVSEGTPLVVIEAMAAGCPVISTDVGGLSEMIDHGQSGMLVPSQDIDGLSERMLELAQDNALRQRLGQRAREVAATRFGIDRMVQDYCDVYADVLA